jgi:hypothetical protein
MSLLDLKLPLPVGVQPGLTCACTLHISLTSVFCLLCFLLFPCAGDPHCAVMCVYVVVHAACLCLVQCFAICALPCEPGTIHPSIHPLHLG